MKRVSDNRRDGACPVTGWVFAPAGRHRKCPTCPHCLLCDHKTEPAIHAHWRDSQQMRGLKSRMFPTPNRKPFCHVALCTCDGV